MLVGILAGLNAVLAILLLLVIKRIWKERIVHKTRMFSAPFGVVVATPKKIQTSPRLLEFLGRDAATRFSNLDELAEGFYPRDREHFSQCIKTLHETGETFHLTTSETATIPPLEITGQRVQGDILLWMEDHTALSLVTESYAEEERKTRLLTAIFDFLPMPIWWRNQDNLNLLGVNKAYLEAMAAGNNEVIKGQKELGRGVIADQGRALGKMAARTGRHVSESHYVVMGTERHLLDFNEAPLEGVSSLIGGYALDVSDVEIVQNSLAEHVAAHDQVLERLSSGIAVFGPDQRLRFFNEAYLRLWNMEEDLISNNPSIHELLDLLRYRRQLPEMVDFKAYRDRMIKDFQSLLEPREDLLHLPDERTLRLTISPHPFGGLLWVFEDVTDRLALERSYKTVTAVQDATLNNLYEAVAVFGTDGRLKLWNKGYMELWDLHPAFLNKKPHISEILDDVRHIFEPCSHWDNLKTKIILKVTEPKTQSGRMDRHDGRIIEYAYVRLPDAQCLLLYMDVTDTTRVRRVLEERNLAFEKASHLKSQFISNVSYELRTPLNSIRGFSELMLLGAAGDLTEKQQNYMEDIMDASSNLVSLIDAILEVSEIQAGLTELAFSEEQAQAIMEAYLADLRDQLQSSGLHLMEASVHPDMEIFCDKRRVLHALHSISLVMIELVQRTDRKEFHVKAHRDGPYLVLALSNASYEDLDGLALDQRTQMQMQGSLTLQGGDSIGFMTARSLLELHGGMVEMLWDGKNHHVIQVFLPERAQRLMERTDAKRDEVAFMPLAAGRSKE